MEDAEQTMDTDRESIRVWLRLPTGYKFLPDGQHQVSITSSDPLVVDVPPFSLPDLSFDWRVPIDVRGEGRTTIRVEGMVFFCPVSDESICMFAAPSAEAVVEVRAGSGGDVELVHDIHVMGAE